MNLEKSDSDISFLTENNDKQEENIIPSFYKEKS